MRIYIRVDASTDIGTGHVVRCLTLATALKNKQHDVTFICRDLIGNLISHIELTGFNVLTLRQTANDFENDDDNSHANWLPVGWQQDAVDCKQSLSNVDSIDWIIVDHYSLDKKWESELSHLCNYMMAIDDLADREHNIDLLLDQNLYPDMDQRYSRFIADTCTTLIGPKYTLLREEFTNVRDRIKIRTQLNNVLIFFGGVDSQNMTLTTISAIAQIDVKVDIIIGSTNPHQQSIVDACASFENMQCHVNVTRMAEFMLQADLAIGAGGTTTWERCYLGLPAVVLTLAQNQAAVNQAVANCGACIIAGDTTTTESEISTQINRIADKPHILTQMSESALSIMQDYQGTKSVVETLENIHA